MGICRLSRRLKGISFIVVLMVQRVDQISTHSFEIGARDRRVTIYKPEPLKKKAYVTSVHR